MLFSATIDKGEIMIKPADDRNNTTAMKDLVFLGLNSNSLVLEDRPKPTIMQATVRLSAGSRY
jgi:hypothetical protein